MNNLIGTENLVSVSKYSGGENAIFDNGNVRVSVCRTDNGLFDVQGENGSTLYTGKDESEAARAISIYMD